MLDQKRQRRDLLSEGGLAPSTSHESGRTAIHPRRAVRGLSIDTERLKADQPVSGRKAARPLPPNPCHSRRLIARMQTDAGSAPDLRAAMRAQILYTTETYWR